jgi:hypothetical protein
MTLPDLIFHGQWLSDGLRGQEQQLNEAAAAIPADHALSASVDELVAELVERFRVEPLVFDWEAMTVSSKDTRIDVSGDWDRAIFDRGSPFYLDGTELTFHIPFTGESDLFKFEPSTHTLSPPRGIVGEHELRLVASATPDRRDGLKASLDAEVA